MRGYSFSLCAPYVVAAATVCIMLGVILLLNHGRLIYIQDDPYIHLALSEHLLHLHHGLNEGEAAAPSSSILWPILLAPAAPFRFHEYLPFFLNLAALFGTIHVLICSFAKAGMTGGGNGRLYTTACVILIVLGLNLSGLAFKGMENLLHALLCASALYGLFILEQEGRLVWWLAPVLVLGPLVRYESLPLSLGILAILTGRKHVWLACWTGGILVCLLGGYSLLLMLLDLPPLPSSVLSKSEVGSGQAGPGTLLTLALNIPLALGSPFSRLSTLIALCFAFSLARQRSSHPAFAWILLGLWCSGCHYAAGKFNARYEYYMLIMLLIMALFVYRGALQKLAERMRPAAGIPLLLLLTALLVGPHAELALVVPLRSNNTYEQQYQMHRYFTGFHRGPVAVNDLGWATYRNHNYVLDVLGLGSERARVARKERKPGWMGSLVDPEKIPLAVLYAELFPKDVPPEWIPVATMRRSRKSALPVLDEVTFFATAPAHVPEIAASLKDFKSALPEEVRLNILPES